MQVLTTDASSASREGGESHDAQALDDACRGALSLRLLTRVLGMT
jgi:hypothetical protein